MSTKVEKVLDRVRLELGDFAEPYLWTDPELLAYLDEAQVEVCREIPIRDSRTKEVCIKIIKAGDQEIPLHESITRVLNIIRVDSNGNSSNIPLANEENALTLKSPMRKGYGVSFDAVRELDQASDIYRVFTDYDERFMRLSSPALTAATLHLQVDRLPLKTLEECDQVLEIRKELEPALIAWACFRAWLKQDGETFDREASNNSFSLFQHHIGRGKIERQRRQTQPGTVRYGGI